MYKKRPIYGYNIHNTNEVVEYNSLYECAKKSYPTKRTDTAVSGIYRSLASEKDEKSIYGKYVFFYDDTDKRIPPSDIRLALYRRSDNVIRKVGDKNWLRAKRNWDPRKRVMAWNDKGERYIFNSLTEAADNVYGAISNISRALTNQNKGYDPKHWNTKDRLTAYGYYWDYID